MEKTLRAATTWGRYAELFAYDYKTGMFSATAETQQSRRGPDALAPGIGVTLPCRKGSGILRSILLTFLLLLAGLTGAWAEENELGVLARHGRALANKMCAQCHAVGPDGSSPHIGAPPFRMLSRRIDLDAFAARLREGLTSGHPDMPTFRFSREDARALTAYLRSIQAP